jgi:hypothetical protein
MREERYVEIQKQRLKNKRQEVRCYVPWPPERWLNTIACFRKIGE